MPLTVIAAITLLSLQVVAGGTRVVISWNNGFFDFFFWLALLATAWIALSVVMIVLRMESARASVFAIQSVSAAITALALVGLLLANVILIQPILVWDTWTTMALSASGASVAVSVVIILALFTTTADEWFGEVKRPSPDSASRLRAG